MSCVVNSKIKEMLKKHGMMCGGDFCEACDKALSEMCAAACARAKANGRKTVRACDC